MITTTHVAAFCISICAVTLPLVGAFTGGNSDFDVGFCLGVSLGFIGAYVMQQLIISEDKKQN